MSILEVVENKSANLQRYVGAGGVDRIAGSRRREGDGAVGTSRQHNREAKSAHSKLSLAQEIVPEIKPIIPYSYCLSSDK
jgi:hypothetical protein